LAGILSHFRIEAGSREGQQRIRGDVTVTEDFQLTNHLLIVLCPAPDLLFSLDPLACIVIHVRPDVAELKLPGVDVEDP
jgi:hypothetical protein